jgi:curved DNA-binding protein CbpA
MNIEECYQILDLAPGESREKVDESFRLLVKVWNPERYAHNPKLQARAQEKLKEINAAKAFLDEHLTKDNEPHSQGAASQSPRLSLKELEEQRARDQEMEAQRKRQEAERREQEKERIRQERARQHEEKLQRDREAAIEQARLEKAQRRQKEILKKEQRVAAKLAGKETAHRQFVAKVILAIVILALIVFLYLI